MKKFSAPVACLLVALLAGSASAGVILVPDHYSEIHDAVQACGYGDTVLVAANTYHDCTHETEGPGSILACVIMKSGVTLIGAGPDATIIDVQGLGRGIFVELVSDCRIENLQVTGAFADVYGAGILLRQVDASVQVANCKIFDNGDGGIICIINASPYLTGIDMIQNINKQGGGLALEENSNAIVTNCNIVNNSAPTAAGVMVRNSNPVMLNCLIADNTVSAPSGNGGGFVIIDSVVDISFCAITGNLATAYGGGFAFQTCPGGTVHHCLIQNNEASGDYGVGGGIHVNASEIEFSYLTIVGNEATGAYGTGGGVDVQFAPSPTVLNCTIADNSCGPIGNAGGLSCQWGGVPVIDKTIIAFSPVGEAMFCVSGTPVVSCTDLYGNAGGDAICGTDAGGNFSADPLFCGAAGVEYHLQAGSPCAPGNHPSDPGECDGDLIGAEPVGCSTTAVSDSPEKVTQLLGNLPNPFNPRTTIFFVLAEPGPVTLRIFDLRGRQVDRFTWSELPAGRQSVEWDGTNHAGRAMPSGVYLYQLEAHHVTQIQRMSLIR